MIKHLESHIRTTAHYGDPEAQVTLTDKGSGVFTWEEISATIQKPHLAIYPYDLGGKTGRGIVVIEAVLIASLAMGNIVETPPPDAKKPQQGKVQSWTPPPKAPPAPKPPSPEEREERGRSIAQEVLHGLLLAHAKDALPPAKPERTAKPPRLAQAKDIVMATGVRVKYLGEPYYITIVEPFGRTS